MADGTRRTIAWLVKHRHQGKVLSIGLNHEIVERDIIGWYRSLRGDRKVFKLNYTGARNPSRGTRGDVLTGDHKVLTRRGWVCVDELRKTDWMATPEPALSKDLRDFVIGSLLGDGGLVVNTPRPALVIATTVAECAEIKRAALGSLYSTTGFHPPRPPRNPKAVYIVQSKHSAALIPFTRWYRRGGKLFPKGTPITARALAVLWMDDGCMSDRRGRKPRGIISLQDFSGASVKRISREIFNRHRICLKPRQNPEGWILNVSTKSLPKLANVVGKFLPPTMRYKLPAGSPKYIPRIWGIGPATCHWAKPICVRSAMPIHEKTMYCLGVAETENFLTTSAVVHNCMPPEKTEPSKGQIAACRPYLVDDIRRLRQRYGTLVILCVGGIASRSLLGCGTTEWFRRQGECVDVICDDDEVLSVPAFATFHPAYLLRGPRHEKAVISHLLLLREFLERGSIALETPPFIVNISTVDGKEVLGLPPLPPRGWHGDIACDLETYGILRDRPDQTQFHPAKMWAFDGVAPRHQIVNAGCTVELDGKLVSFAVQWSLPEHRRVLQMWLDAASSFTNQMLQFDMKLIRAAGLRLPAWKPLNEHMIESFYYDDSMPERSIKSSGLIMRTTSYANEKKPVKAYDDEWDLANHRYACKDSWTAKRNIQKFRKSMHDRYDHHPVASAKMDPYRLQFSSDLVWTATLMEEAGICMDAAKLQKAHDTYDTQRRQLRSELRDRSITPCGEGSEKSILHLVYAAKDAVEAHGNDTAKQRAAELQTTEKLDEISTAMDNRNALIGALPRSVPYCAELAATLGLVNEHESLSKILDSYTGPLLFGKKISSQPLNRWNITRTKSKSAKSCVRRTGSRGSFFGYDAKTRACRWGLYRLRVYPQWLLVPREADNRGRGGGVVQARWSAKDPAAQTWPDPIKACVCSRFPGGTVFAWDLKQIEWRMAAYCANDARMQMEAKQNIDIHSRAAAFLLDWPNLLPATVKAKLPVIKPWLIGAPTADMRDKARMFYSGSKHLDDGNDFVAFVMKWLRQQVGKSENFSWLFGSTAITVVTTARTKSGIDVPDSRGHAFVDSYDSLYPELRQFREMLIESVLRDGALHLPVLGDSRTFGGSEDDIRGQYRGQIWDFPIQAPSARLLQAAMIAISCKLTGAGGGRVYQSCVTVNEHDSVWIDTHPDEVNAVKDFAAAALQPDGTEYARRFSRFYGGRRLPVEFEVKEVGFSPEAAMLQRFKKIAI